MSALPWYRLSAYGILGFPLAFAALPLYVHLPHFYVEHVGLSLASVGLVLLLARLADALIDPWLGVWSDWQAWCYGATDGPCWGRRCCLSPSA
ncbi:MAG: MFS transporter [Rhodocyclaceae bacterium]|nr:MFS transporter [Rhodocyclaceae bacterium]